jgi:hypothetical protein
MKSRGWTIARIRAQLKADGDPVPSPATVSGMVKGTSKGSVKAPRKRPKGKETSRPAKSQEQASEPEQAGKSLALLYQQRDSCAAALKEADGNPEDLVKVGRVLNQTIAQIEKLEPTPPPPVEEPPDYSEASDRGRERMHAYIDAALKGEL